jgi:hypothetical protein
MTRDILLPSYYLPIGFKLKKYTRINYVFESEKPETTTNSNI